MKTKVIKILCVTLVTIVLPLSYISCGDENIISVYNKLTDHYRNTPEDRLSSPDSCITVKVLGCKTGMPMVNIHVVLTTPANDTMGINTDKEGFAVFKLPAIGKGNYYVKTSLFENDIEYSRRNSYYLYEKNNSTLTIYINENPWYE